MLLLNFMEKNHTLKRYIYKMEALKYRGKWYAGDGRKTLRSVH